MSRCVNRLIIIVMLTLGCFMTVKVKGNRSLITQLDDDIVKKQLGGRSSVNLRKSVGDFENNYIVSGTNAADIYCDNILSCTNRDLYIKIFDITGRGKYKLSENLFFEKLPSANVSGVTNETDILLKKNGVTTFVLMKKMMDIFKTHTLRLHLLRDLDIAMFKEDGVGEPKLAVALEANEFQRGGRTFGHGILRRRIVFVLLAIMFKLGIMSTLLWILLILTLKGLKIGMLLLALALFNFFIKVYPHVTVPSIKISDWESKKSTAAPHYDPSGYHSDGHAAHNPYSYYYPPYPYPYPYPQPGSHLQQPTPVPHWKNIQSGYQRRENPPYIQDDEEDEMRYPELTSQPSAKKPAYSVYYQRKNGQFYPIMLNEVHRQNSNGMGEHEEMSADVRPNRRRKYQQPYDEYTPSSTAYLTPSRRSDDIDMQQDGGGNVHYDT